MGVKYQTPRWKSQLPSLRKLPSCTRKCLRQKSERTILRAVKSSKFGLDWEGDKNTFEKAFEFIQQSFIKTNATK